MSWESLSGVIPNDSTRARAGPQKLKPPTVVGCGVAGGSRLRSAGIIRPAGQKNRAGRLWGPALESSSEAIPPHFGIVQTKVNPIFSPDDCLQGRHRRQ